MTPEPLNCPDCQGPSRELDRRKFLTATAGAAAAAATWPIWTQAQQAATTTAAAGAATRTPETLVKSLYDTLNDQQRQAICFAWDYQHPSMGLLRTRVSNNWHITTQTIGSDFYTAQQKEMIRAIFEGLYNPEWLPQIERQLQDDAGGYGRAQNIAIFGRPGDDKFELVMTGRHLTIRCDGNSAEHVAFGGPIFYGHAARGFNEASDHPGNIFWPQAQEANRVFQMLDGAQRQRALVARTPAEAAVAFRGPDATFPGIPVADLSADQKTLIQGVLAKLLEPYRNTDREEVQRCLTAQGGIDKCSLAFYQQGDIGDDSVWDNWRLEGPSFVWYFRGSPHVHVWVNIADSHQVTLNAAG